MSSYRTGGFLIGRSVLAMIGLLAAMPAFSQYPGQVTKTGKDTPELRAIAVLEWVGEAGKPARSRLVPVAVLDGGKLEDGGIYMARPEPLSLAGEVEYELEQGGKPIGLYDIRNAGQEQGSWVGYGSWRPMPVARPKSSQNLARTRIDDDVQGDEPVLHRKRHGDDGRGGGSTSGGSGSGGGSGNASGSSSGTSTQASEDDPATDPDRPTLHRSTSSSGSGDSGSSSGNSSSAQAPAAASDGPTLHKKTSSDSSSDTSSSAGAGGSTTSTTTPASQTSDTSSDPDRPTLHRSPSADSTGNAGSSQSSSSDSPTLHRRDSTGAGSSGSDSAQSDSASSNDPDRPVLHKARKVQAEESGDSVAEADPDRPTLKRGRSGGSALDVVPSLIGLPPEVQQAVAVSDAKTHPVHPWTYSWSSPDDEAKMKSAMEDMARNALGLNPPAPKAAPKRSTTTPVRKTAKPAPPPPAPAPLSGEQFRVFELAYGSGATLVLSAHTDGPAAQEKFVTLIAQPDLYGNMLVLMKNVTDGSHLDEKPRMKLVDAVDAMADNRGELLFELRGATQRQFALYRVLRGQAEKLFVSGGADFGTDSRD